MLLYRKESYKSVMRDMDALRTLSMCSPGVFTHFFSFLVSLGQPYYSIVHLIHNHIYTCTHHTSLVSKEKKSLEGISKMSQGKKMKTLEGLEQRFKETGAELQRIKVPSMIASGLVFISVFSALGER